MNLLAAEPALTKSPQNSPPKLPPKSTATRIVWVPKPEEELRYPEPAYRPDAMERAANKYAAERAEAKHAANAELGRHATARHARMHAAGFRMQLAIRKAEEATGLGFYDLFIGSMHGITLRGEWAAKRARFYDALRGQGASLPDIADLCGVGHSTVLSSLNTLGR